MSAGANFLYAANFRSGAVDVFDKNYSPVTLGAHAFWDPRIPRKFAPFNFQNINGMIFVSYAKQDDAKHDEVDGRGLGFVDVFDTSGALQMRLEWSPWMNAPWGRRLGSGELRQV